MDLKSFVRRFILPEGYETNAGFFYGKEPAPDPKPEPIVDIGELTRLRLRVSYLERVQKGRDNTLELREAEHTRLVRELEDRRAVVQRHEDAARAARAEAREWMERALKAEAAQVTTVPMDDPMFAEVE